jgi:CubicO group peptidase (beta-lactamase class C family)
VHVQSSIKVDRYPGENFPSPITLENWQQAPYSRWGFAHVSELITTASIRRGSDAARPWESQSTTAASSPEWVEVDRFLEETHTDAFVVLHNGKIVYERYLGTFRRQDRHILMSVSKSICSLVIGALVGKGLIDPEAQVETYVPALAGSGYGDATVRQVLDMTAGVHYSEDYADPDSEVRVQDRVARWNNPLPHDPADTYEFLSGLQAAGEHGAAFKYRSAGTDVLAWIAENVTGCRYPEVVSEELWSLIGCEDDAYITTDEAGFAFANGGVACTARDLLRIGELMLNRGRQDARQVIPEEWITDIFQGGDPSLARGSAYQQVHPNGSYRSQWWVPGDERGAIYAAGIHGQFIWTDPLSRTVIVKFSSGPEPTSIEHNRRHAEGFRRVVELLD